MQLVEGNVLLSASDLIGHLNCRHLTQLDLEVIRGSRAKPFRADPFLESLAERGRQHEEAYIQHLRSQGRSVVEIGGKGFDAVSANETLATMKKGADVIVQAPFLQGAWGGRADVLLRVDKPSAFGAWSYEVADTKLAQETRGGTILQLCLYSELLAQLQERPPEMAYVVTPETGYEPRTTVGSRDWPSRRIWPSRLHLHIRTRILTVMCAAGVPSAIAGGAVTIIFH